MEELISTNSEFSIAYIDLDDLKKMVDSIGYDNTTLFVKTLSHNIQKSLEKGEKLVEAGGDEFILVFPKKHKTQELIERLADLQNLIGRNFSCNGKDYKFSASIGIANYPKDGNNKETLISNAMQAMYLSKKAGKSTISFYDEDLQKELEARRVVQNSLKDAVFNGEFYIEYQPQFTIPERRLRGIAVLVNWDAPGKTAFLDPKEFLPLAEETDSILDVGFWIYKNAFRDYMRVRDSYDFPPVLAIDSSYKQIRAVNFVFELKELVESKKMDWESIEFVISDEDKMLTDEKVHLALKELHEKGLKLMLAVRSIKEKTLDYIKELPLTGIKISHVLTEQLVNDEKIQNFVKKAIEEAHKQDLTVLADGVSETEQFNFFVEQSCDSMQGNLLCRPTSIAAL